MTHKTVWLIEKLWASCRGHDWPLVTSLIKLKFFWLFRNKQEERFDLKYGLKNAKRGKICKIFREEKRVFGEKGLLRLDASVYTVYTVYNMVWATPPAGSKWAPSGERGRRGRLKPELEPPGALKSHCRPLPPQPTGPYCERDPENNNYIIKIYCNMNSFNGISGLKILENFVGKQKIFKPVDF